MKFQELKYRWLIVPVIALFFFGLTIVAAHHPQWVEEFYSNSCYPFIARILSPVSALAPFSLDDLFFMLLILTLPLLIIVLILRKITFRFAGKLVLNILAAIYVLFYFLWGFNYFRETLNTRLGLSSAEITGDQFSTVFVKLIGQTNRSQCTIDSLNKRQVDSLVEESYARLSGLLKIDYPSGVRNDKTITFSTFFAQSGIAGYFGPFFNEVHVNKAVTPLEYPVVLAHEKAHQLGVTSEAEANFYAWLVCSGSPSKELRYSANYFLLCQFIEQAYQREDFKQFVSMINPSVKEDYNRITEHWQALRNEKMEHIAAKVNDTYLKTNRVEAGVQDYTGVVRFFIEFELDTAFQRRWNLDHE